jgi:hypothetical protein
VFARRAAWDLTPNPLSERVAARRKLGLPVLDLSNANPTHAGLAAPAEALALALGELARDAAALRYDADPRGDPAVRAAIAACHPRAAPDDVVLTAGTSEGYAHLFRMLADPGDLVHVPTPGYPLFEHLAELEGLEVARYPLRPPPPAAGARWRIDLPALAATLSPRSRALLVIHPHSPTGSFVDRDDLAALRALGRERGFALVSDEVFAASASEGGEPGALVGAEQGPLHFVLSGASKLLALPQLKVAWIAVGGPARERAEAVARLEFVSDAYLSVSPLLASLLPRLLGQRDEIRRELLERIATNRAQLRAALAGRPGVECLPAEAGWSAIVRVGGDGAPPDEEELVLALLERAGILVQPGFLFDLEGVAGRPAAHLVLCLLAEPERFAEGAHGLARFLGEGQPRER